ncbi:hypothetical protein GCM10010307_53090 [Streptomyces vastus]|uniref:Uncharacterized protein n=1 Tax=Streptomyces vastus TaxID=285451 RepID=A0ABN3R9F5_9ACTN
MSVTALPFVAKVYASVTSAAPVNVPYSAWYTLPSWPSYLGHIELLAVEGQARPAAAQVVARRRPAPLPAWDVWNQPAARRDVMGRPR